MIDEQLEEQASLYALGVIEPDEKAAFEAKLAVDQELRFLVDDLTAAAASLAHTAAPRLPPPHLEESIMRQVRGDKVTALPARRPSWIPWALAASLALSTALLFFGREKMRRQLADVQAQRDQTQSELAKVQHRETEAQTQLADLQAQRNQTQSELAKVQHRETEAQTQLASLATERERLAQELKRLEERDSLSQMQIATLSSKLAEAPRAAAFVIWDAKNQRGVLTAVNIPANAEDHDYQLWVVDPKYQIPVDAGVFHVEKNGVAKVLFKPKQHVNSADAFAVSLERKGGVPKAEGPMVLVGK
ncbi:MAG: anti-sigma factor [Verrucomicrobiaceae bacterium]|nr:anti-sigma factor [Verrucomicrobiaceae bacterium]